MEHENSPSATIVQSLIGPLKQGNENEAGRKAAKVRPTDIHYLAFLGILCLAFWPISIDMLRIWWTSSAHHHEMFALPIALFLIWQRRENEPIAFFNKQTFLHGSMIAAPFAGVLILGYSYDVSFLKHLALVGFMIAGFVIVRGAPQAKYHFMFLLVLFFMVPFGDIIIPPLQSITTSFIEAVFHLTQMDISRSGYLLTTSSGQFFVDRACAGIRFLMAALMISYIFGISNTRNWRAIILFMGAAALIALGANLMRAYSMVLIATLSKMRLATGVDHYYFGWVLYFLTFAVIIFIGKKLIARFDDPVSSTQD